MKLLTIAVLASFWTAAAAQKAPTNPGPGGPVFPARDPDINECNKYSSGCKAAKAKVQKAYGDFRDAEKAGWVAIRLSAYYCGTHDAIKNTLDGWEKKSKPLAEMLREPTIKCDMKCIMCNPQWLDSGAKVESYADWIERDPDSPSGPSR